MAGTFYDKVAQRFGSYSSNARRTAEYPIWNPEEVFEQQLRTLAGKEKRALDVGAGDGRFTLRTAEVFEHIVGIDTSEGMLEVARRLLGEGGVENVTFLYQDARRTPFPDASFDVVYSRRGPSFLREYYRLLVVGGYFLHITIGNRDAVELKEVFGRGQDFAERDISRLESDGRQLHGVGFRVVHQADYYYDEYYASYEDLQLFLEGVPIFEDFDPDGDRAPLEAYAARFREERGIRLPRHRVIDIARKR